MFIVNFHNIVSGPLDAYDLSIAPRLDVPRFTATIDWLERRFDVLPLDEVIAQSRRAQTRARASVALTFDDGYLGALEHAFPILRARGLVASVMVVTQVLDSPAKLLHFEELEVAFRISKVRTMKLPGRSDRSIATLTERIACLKAVKQELKLQAEPERRRSHEQLLHLLEVTRAQIEEASSALPNLRKLDIEQLRFLVESGWTVGGHTRTHRTLSCLDEGDLMEEIVGSRDALRARFGPAALAFAYPYGGPQHIGERARDLVASSGYSCALTTTPGRNTPGTDLYRLRRINVEDLHRERPDVLDRDADRQDPSDHAHEQSSLFCE